MRQEQILREALAFILSQKSLDISCRKIAFTALKRAYGNQIEGHSLEEFDRINDDLFNERMQKLQEHYSQNLS